MYNRFIAVAVETMHDQIATKSDNRRRLSDRLEAAATAIRRDLKEVHLRLERIEDTLSSETDRRRF